MLLNCLFLKFSIPHSSGYRFRNVSVLYFKSCKYLSQFANNILKFPSTLALRKKNKRLETKRLNLWNLTFYTVVFLHFNMQIKTGITPIPCPPTSFPEKKWCVNQNFNVVTHPFPGFVFKKVLYRLIHIKWPSFG